MEGTALPGRLSGAAQPVSRQRLLWRPARVVGTRFETPHVRTLVLDVPGWAGHRAGQHVDIRLTAEDGYQAQRSYSIASAPGARYLELTVERLEDGEVSPYLVDAVRTGDVFELRGPIGGYFVWLPELRRPLALVAGGSGIVPLMAMLRHRAVARDQAHGVPPARLLYSARTGEDIIHRGELDALAAGDAELHVAYTLTRERPPAWTGFDRRIDRGMLEDVFWPPSRTPLVYVCGPTAMVEAVATELVALGHPPAAVRTERFGPSGTPTR